MHARYLVPTLHSARSQVEKGGRQAREALRSYIQTEAVHKGWGGNGIGMVALGDVFEKPGTSW